MLKERVKTTSTSSQLLFIGANLRVPYQQVQWWIFVVHILYATTTHHMQTISYIFTPQTTFQHEECDQRRRGKTLGKSSWSMNIYCTFTVRGLEVVKTNLAILTRNQNAESGGDPLIVQVE